MGFRQRTLFEKTSLFKDAFWPDEDETLGKNISDEARYRLDCIPLLADWEYEESLERVLTIVVDVIFDLDIAVVPELGDKRLPVPANWR